MLLRYLKSYICNSVAERHSVDAIKSGDFEVPEFKKLAHGITERTPNPFANNGSAPVERNPFDNAEVASESEGFATLEDDDCPF